ncbi:MAG TPA: universal stress protein [Arachnia sp.]|nr:universal stress protein [Arachnia sp.]
MKVAVWLDVATWPAVVEEARGRPGGDEIALLAVDDPGEVPSLVGGLMGRGRRQGPDASGLIRDQAAALLERAAEALGRPCEKKLLSGRTERVVTEAVNDADMLILARDGDRSRLGPRSLGAHARFVIDHAPCSVVVIWPENPPDLATIPPPPSAR